MTDLPPLPPGRTAWQAARTPRGMLASGFGIGLLPLVPGTWASLATLPLAWLIHDHFGPLGLGIASLVAFLIGIAVADHVVKDMGAEDPSVIVIDEVAGQLLTCAAAPLTIAGYAAAFVAFRAFDLGKPWPVGWADRELGGGFGTMVDDMMAGVYAAAIVLAANLWGWL